MLLALWRKADMLCVDFVMLQLDFESFGYDAGNDCKVASTE